MTIRTGLATVFAICLWAAPGAGASAAGADDAATPQPLAVVNGDTLTTRDLQLELNVMLRRVADEPVPDQPAADAVLTRLIQNLLLVQEGYRMGIEQRLTVRNQVESIVREKSMTALLDSVAATAPADAPDALEARRTAVEGFIDGLKRAYAVEVDSLLLASLDYGSNDQAVYQRLQNSDEVLVSMTGRVLRVRGLTQVIRWEEFHGLGGRPDAAAVRDKIFKSWVSETLVMLEAADRGFDRKPEVVAVARAVERALVHEETFRALVKVDFDPSEEEIEEYYRTHLDEFMAAARIKLHSVMLNAEEPARLFCDRLRQGAKLSWLAKRTPEVVEGPPPFPADWYLPEQLGVSPEDATAGFVPEPYEVPGGGWIAAVVADVEDPLPQPLDQCRRQVMALMKGEYLQNSIIDVISRLEKAADIRTVPGAEAIVDRHLDAAYAALEQE